MSPGVLRRFRWPSAWPWAPFFNYFDQSKFVRGIGLNPLERGDEFGMGNGWIHKDSIVKSAASVWFESRGSANAAAATAVELTSLCGGL